MDDAARHSVPDGSWTDAMPPDSFAEEHRARIAARNARLAARLADPAAAVAQWQAENAEAIAAYNAWFAAEGEQYLADLIGDDHPLSAAFKD